MQIESSNSLMHKNIAFLYLRSDIGVRKIRHQLSPDVTLVKCFGKLSSSLLIDPFNIDIFVYSFEIDMMCLLFKDGILLKLAFISNTKN